MGSLSCQPEWALTHFYKRVHTLFPFKAFTQTQLPRTCASNIEWVSPKVTNELLVSYWRKTQKWRHWDRDANGHHLRLDSEHVRLTTETSSLFQLLPLVKLYLKFAIKYTDPHITWLDSLVRCNVWITTKKRSNTGRYTRCKEMQLECNLNTL